MTTRDPAILRAERLRTIMNMPEYHDTIGAWIAQLKAEAIDRLSRAVEMNNLSQGQGWLQAYNFINDYFEVVFANEKQALKKQQKGGEDD